MSNIVEVVIKDEKATHCECILSDGENMYKDNIIKINGVAQKPDTSCNHLNKKYYQSRGFLVLSEEEANKIMDANSLLKYTKDFEEISEDRYFYLLEVLPPKKFQETECGNIFLISEYTYKNITDVVVEHKGRYFTSTCADNISYTTHINNIEAKFFNSFTDTKEDEEC